MQFVPPSKTRKKTLSRKKLEKRVVRFMTRLGNLCRKEGLIMGFNDGFVFFAGKDERIFRTGAALDTTMVMPDGLSSCKCRMVNTGNVYIASGRFLEKKAQTKKAAPIREKAH